MKHPLLVLGLVASLAPLRIVASEATFVADTANPGSTVSTAVDFSTVAVTLTDPGTPLRGTVTLTATATSDRGLQSVRFQSAPAGSGAWTDLCTDTAAPFTCAFDTTSVADGPRDVRALALDKAGYSRTAAIAARQVDNTAPATNLADPGTPLSGTKTLTATATDAGSGVASVALQYRSAGGAWTTICERTSCRLDTRTLTDGLYDLRSRVTDVAGNTATSVVTDRRIDNSAPTASLADPGSPLRASVALSATVSDDSGVAAVTFERRAAGTSAWTTIGTVAAAPFTHAWTTSDLGDGLYDLRVTAVDTLGHTSVSAVVSDRRIDNTGPRGAVIEAVNGRGTAGRIDTGDVLTFTYSEQLDPASVLDGWDGARTDVNVHIGDIGRIDSLFVRKGTSHVALTALLAPLLLSGDYTSTGAEFAATMQQVGEQVVVTFGKLTAGSTRTTLLTGRLLWTPASSVTDLAGNGGTNALVTGSLGRDF